MWSCGYPHGSCHGQSKVNSCFTSFPLGTLIERRTRNLDVARPMLILGTPGFYSLSLISFSIQGWDKPNWFWSNFWRRQICILKQLRSRKICVFEQLESRKTASWGTKNKKKLRSPVLIHSTIPAIAATCHGEVAGHRRRVHASWNSGMHEQKRSEDK